MAKTELPKTVKLYFSNGDLEECIVTTDGNGEVVCYARDKRFVKFGGVATADDLKAAVKSHNDLNKDIPMPPDEDDGQAAELAAWFAGDVDGGIEPVAD